MVTTRLRSSSRLFGSSNQTVEVVELSDDDDDDGDEDEDEVRETNDDGTDDDHGDGRSDPETEDGKDAPAGRKGGVIQRTPGRSKFKPKLQIKSEVESESESEVGSASESQSEFEFEAESESESESGSDSPGRRPRNAGQAPAPLQESIAQLRLDSAEPFLRLWIAQFPADGGIVVKQCRKVPPASVPPLSAFRLQADLNRLWPCIVQHVRFGPRPVVAGGSSRAVASWGNGGLALDC